MTARALLVVVMGALLSACGGYAITMTVAHASPRALTPRPREQVELLSAPPARPCTEIGVITFTAARGLLAPSHAYADDVAYAIWGYAANVGCDAVVVAGDQGACLVYADATGAPVLTSASARATPPRAP